MYYSVNNGNSFDFFKTLNLLPDTVIITLPLEIGELINSENAKLKIKASDGSNIAYDISEKFSKQTPRISVNSQYVHLISGVVNLPYSINVINPSILKGDEYIISFNDTSSTGEKYFSVFNNTTSNFVLANEELFPEIENKAFDGLSFFANNIIDHI